MFKIKQKHVYISLVAMCAASGIFMFYALCHHVIGKNRIISSTKIKFQSETDRLVSEIDASLISISNAAETAAKDFSKGNNEKELIKQLTGLAASEKNIIKFGMTLDPEGGGQPAGKQSQAYVSDNGKVRQVQQTEAYDITSEPWAGRDARSGAGWDEPLFDDDAKYYTVTFSAPLYGISADGQTPAKVRGAVYIDVTLAWLKKKMDSLSLEKNDVGTILSKKGTILYHPISDLVYNRSNIFDMLEARKASNKNYERQLQIIKKAVSGESGSGLNRARTGESFWYFYKPVLATGWALVVNFTKDAVALNGKDLRRQAISIALGAIVFLTSLAALLLRLYILQGHKKRQLWGIVIIFSSLCFATACYTWYLALSIPLSEYQQKKIVIDDPVSLNRFTESCTKLSQDMSGKEPVFIPTGINIQSMDFSRSNDITISGYVWQRYARPSDDDVPRGFSFPEAETVTMTEEYRKNDGKEEVIGWHFEAVIRQSFDYSKYPFDHPNIAVWLRHKDFMNNVILVPDLKGYRSVSASSLPGLQARLVLTGYTISGTFFSQEPRLLNANFGVASDKKEVRLSEFAYNVIITRNFITPLVAKFFPIFIVISMLFIVTLSFSTDAVKQKNFGLSGLAIFGLVVSFFFSTLLTQVDLRQQLKADNIIFIENFNFVTYLVLLLSAIQAFLFSAEKKIWFIQYEHCLIPKLLYWPIFTALMLAISLVYFF